MRIKRAHWQVLLPDFESNKMFTPREIERIAYINNDQATLSLLAMLEDDADIAIDNAVETARESAYSEGYAAGLNEYD